MVTTFKYVEGGPDRNALEVVWDTSSIRIFKCMCKHWIPYEKMAGRTKENLPRGRLKSPVRILKNVL